MHIKQVIIQGFKSYKDQTVIEPFSPRHNVIVGRNGSGKSNFFAAIRFVLGDAYTQMGKEERHNLLHEGTGSAVMSAYVEIIFDNSDERFPTGKEELILRRTIGAKKDEYSLDRKNATKSDVMNLLESAGFSRSNPYYIVPQGRVTTLTNMKDSERLTLLKEVAGTQVYEARRTESLKIMNETNNKRAKIDELLDYINERLHELEEEKDELRTYQEKDRERRCLDYTIEYRTQQEINRALDQIEQAREAGVDDTDDNRERFVQGEQDMAQVDAEIAELRQQMEFLKVDKQQLENERRDAARSRAQVELQVKGLLDGQAAAQQAKARRDADLSDIQRAIAQKEAELGLLLPSFNVQKQQEDAIKSQLDDAEAAQNRLYAKQGRNAEFRSKKERDDWLREQMADTYTALSQVKAVRMQTTEDIKELEQELATMSPEVEKLRKQLDGNDAQSLDQQIQAAGDERDRLMDQRKEYWREEDKIRTIVENAEKELERAERKLSHMMDHNTSRGLAAVRRIKRQYNLDGVYGTLAELLDVSDPYRTAVEVTAGTSLFHVVVDNDDTASKVLEVLNKEKAGRVTFMPLNRLKAKDANIPKSSDAIPLLSKIKYNSMYERAFQQVFGKTVLCRDLQQAAQFARSHGLNAITPEGDRSDKRGALTGGFHDPRSSRLEAVRTVTKWRDECGAKKARRTEIRRSLELQEQQITKAVGELQKLEQRRQQFHNDRGRLRLEFRSKQDLIRNKQETLEAKQKAMQNIEASLKHYNDQQNAYETELGTEFKKDLTKAEETELQNLVTTVQDLRKQYSEVSATRSELETRKAILEAELQENLQPRLDQLLSQDADSAEAGGEGTLNDHQRKLKRHDKNLQGVTSRLHDAEESIETAMTQIQALEARNAEVRKQMEDIAKDIERHQRRMEKDMHKKAQLQKSAAETAQRIQDLGVLPQEAHTKYMKLESSSILKRIKKVNEALKKYSHVNKKAFEQYNNFTKQRETLTTRREELDASQTSIDDLIRVLDQRKDEAIERTFKQVSKEFTTVFEKLVPAGYGRLIIQRKTDRAAQQRQQQQQQPAEELDSEEEEAARKGGSVENYIGVSISVSFNSKHDDQQRIQQLSGGQKSLCALALVFAIQACDPAPFYLFDEIDANLDAQYRTAVSQMLQDKSQNGQFICTTFRPEMLLVAEKCYGVSFRGKASSIGVVSREEAVAFVEGEKS